MHRKNSFIRHYAPLFPAIFFIVAYLLPLGGRLMTRPDEFRYAEIPREMLVTGNFAVPALNGLAYYEKPALGYWLTAASMALLGQNRFAVRFPSALFTLLTAGTVFLLGARGRDRRTGTLACALFLSSGLVFAVGTSAVLDPPFAFFVTAGTAAGYFYHTERDRRKKILYLFLAGLFVGCGIMIKGLLSPLLAGVAVAAFLLLKKEYRQLAAAVLPVLAGMAVSALPGGALHASLRAGLLEGIHPHRTRPARPLRRGGGR